LLIIARTSSVADNDSGSPSPVRSPSPSIVLADEPTANLDKATGREILSLMKQINRRLKTTFIFSTHDQKVIDRADRLVQMEDGCITAFGVRNEIDKSWSLARVRPVTDAEDE
jgi:putative ABC transport system ATP-binding protein